jgi:hypothetical protein
MRVIQATVVLAALASAAAGGFLAGKNGTTGGTVAPAGGTPAAAAVGDPAREERMRRLAEDLGIAQRILGQREGELDARTEELRSERNRAGSAVSDAEGATRSLRDLQRRLVPGTDAGRDLPRLVAWVVASLEQTALERDRALEEAQQGRDSARRREEELEGRVATASRRTTELEREVSTLTGDRDEWERVARQPDARVTEHLKNLALTLRNTGDPVWIEWALVLYKDENANIRIRPESFQEDDNGWKAESGGTVNLGSGLGIVFLCENPDNDAQTVTAYQTLTSAHDGTFEFNHRW